MSLHKHGETFTFIHVPADYDFYDDDAMHNWCEEHAGDRSYSWGYDDRQKVIWFTEPIVASLFKLTFEV